jgi:hypothetical protein
LSNEWSGSAVIAYRQNVAAGVDEVRAAGHAACIGGCEKGVTGPISSMATRHRSGATAGNFGNKMFERSNAGSRGRGDGTGADGVSPNRRPHVAWRGIIDRLVGIWFGGLHPKLVLARATV